MTRSIGPSKWPAPGLTHVQLSIIQTLLSDEPLVLDDWESEFSPCQVDTIRLSSSAPVAIPVPDTTNCRFVFVILPRQNTATVQFRWNNADVGKYCNKQGFFADTFDGDHMPSNLYYVVSADVTGVTIIWG